MIITEMPIRELKPYPLNAKQHDEKQIANVANSIKRFGWQQPLVIDESNVVIIGHCRLMAAKKLGLKVVPVTVASGLTEEEIRELRIADNKTNESPWDFELLAEDIDGLTFEGFDFDFGLNDAVSLGDFEGTEHGNLAEQFLVPPFSVLRGDSNAWLNRKRAWQDLGIKSELGRG